MLAGINNSVYEYYDFGLSPRSNAFMTKVVQKYRFYNSIYSYPYAYMSQQEKKILLGDPTFKKRLPKLSSDGFITEIILGRNPNNRKQFIVGYIPANIPYQRKNEYLPFMDRYYLLIKRHLSPEAIYIYDTMMNSSINITDYQLAEALFHSCQRHGYTNVVKYISENTIILNERIRDFNSNSSMYIVEDPFGNRVHTFISNLPREIRKEYVFIDENPTVELDLRQSQMVILGKIIYELYGENSFSRKVMITDIYEYFGKMNGLTNRDESKILMFRALFDKKGSKADLMFKEAFPDTYPFIENIKSINLSENPSGKWYSNLAFMLQREESGIFRQVWNELKKEEIKFLTVHDSVIVKHKDKHKASKIMKQSLQRNIGSHIIIRV